MLSKVRRWTLSIVSILPLILSLANITPVSADSARPDISVKITADRRSIRVGQTVTYTVKATNHSPNPAPMVDVYVYLPYQLSMVSMECAYGISPDTPACEYSVLAPGETVITTVVATPNPDARPHKRHLVTTTRIMFEDPTIDSDPSNNAASVAVRWVGRIK